MTLTDGASSFEGTMEFSISPLVLVPCFAVPSIDSSLSEHFPEGKFESLSSAGSTCVGQSVGAQTLLLEFCDSFAVWSQMAPCDPNAGSPGATEGMPECLKVIADLYSVVLVAAPDMTLLRDVVSCPCVCVSASVVYVYTSGRNVYSMPV